MLNSVVNEGSTAYLGVRLMDKLGAPAVPAALSYSVRCLTTGTDLRANVALTPGSQAEIVLTPTDNAIQTATNKYETRLVTVVATYNVDDAQVEEFTYQVRNLEGY
jgi:hypothetical protein